ncbi:peptide deformylase [Secundilactobacillus odoratitofui DSM 19909 = JCM 15043]|uniref:Peptide deformylase n=1 Tax=Secundilactobacillus odoratitofui DSM 19909 = JCM 15043 TaxID=1423776 RepID=A0A0R1M1M7_9LACO|nr:peptide deformylase [Secundilactobacillus odoratitofui]KRK98506.1 peptide deformylase [Secundilactobacillus odoratitofui DSM 19909 = JCM 15043]
MIKTINHSVAFLQKKATKATPMDSAVVTDLMDTLKANTQRCVGMAANMIGVNKRIIVVQMGMLSVPMINPEIVKQSGAYEAKEGCLSLEGQRKATRYQEIEVKYQDQNFKAHTQKFSDFTAQIIQHEIDHTNGVLI